MWFVKAKRAMSTGDFETWKEGGVTPTLNGFDNTGDSRATVLILDGTRVNDVRIYDDEITPCLKNRMGTGGNNVPFVAYPIQGTLIGRAETSGPRGPGIRDNGEPMYTLDTISCHGVAHQEEENMIVRRLTPTECERLMGWPDNHTLHRADGKTNSDTNRYKMCGNGVASPVAEWIAHQITKFDNGV